MSNAEYLSRPFPLLAKLATVLRNIAPVRKAFVRFATLLRGRKKSDEPLVNEFVGDIPNVAGEIPEIIDEAPAVAAEAPGITDEIPGVADAARDATDEAPAGVTDGVPEVADEVPEVTDDPPGVTDETPGITDEAPELSEASEPTVMSPAMSAEAPLAPVCSLSARERLIRRRWAETGIKMWAGLGALNIQGSAELLPLQPGATRREYDRLEFRLIAGDIVCEGVVVDSPSDRK
jgi:hypothetical protein